MAAHIKIDIRQYVATSAEKAYSDLCDWKGHERWVPLTKITVHSPLEFTAYTGLRPLVLKDRMRVIERNDDSRQVTLEKLGPVLTGTARFCVKKYGNNGCVVDWYENIEIPYLPGFLSSSLTAFTRRLFRYALRRLARP